MNLYMPCALHNGPYKQVILLPLLPCALNLLIHSNVLKCDTWAELEACAWFFCVFELVFFVLYY